MDKGTEDYLRENYGYLASFLDVPEVGDILRRVAVQGDPLYHADQAKLEGAIFSTNWWKTHSQAQRNWKVMRVTDPGQANKLRADAKYKIQQYAQTMGITLTSKRLTSMSDDFNRFGWNDDELHRAIASEFKYNPAKGQNNPTIDNIKEAADDMVVSVGDRAIQTWARRIIGGSATMDTYKSYLQNLAKGTWQDPNIQKAIEGGMTTKQALDPYTQKFASLLEVPSAEVNWNDQKWSGLLQKKDPKTGVAYMPTITDAASEVMKDQRFGYDKTQGARDQASQLTSQLGQLFGVQG